MKSKFFQYTRIILGIGLVVIILLPVLGCGLFDFTTSSVAESRARGTLRSIGSSQLAYQQTNNDQVYGSFEAMVDTMYIAEGYNLDNMIEYYTMTWYVGKYPVSVSPRYTAGIRSTFTVVAWPTDTRGVLRTFGVTEDQVVRVYNPESENDLQAVQSWDPIL